MNFNKFPSDLFSKTFISLFFEQFSFKNSSIFHAYNAITVQNGGDSPVFKQNIGL